MQDSRGQLIGHCRFLAQVSAAVAYAFTVSRKVQRDERSGYRETQISWEGERRLGFDNLS